MKVLVADAIPITPSHEAALVIAMLAEIVAASQLLIIAEAKIIMLNLKTDQDPALVAHKTLTIILTIIHDDKWDWKQDCDLPLNSCTNRE